MPPSLIIKGASRLSINAPSGHEGEWIKTNTGKGWFTYFRIYGPEAPVFDGSWKPGTSKK